MDIFYQFIDLYEKGSFLEALQTIISNPDIEYDKIISNHPALPLIANFADATVFYSLVEALDAHEALSYFLNHHSTDATIQSFKEMLAYEATLLHLFIDDHFIEKIEGYAPIEIKEFFTTLHAEDTLKDCSGVLHWFPPYYQSFIQDKCQMLNHWIHFKKHRPELAHAFQGEHPILPQIPWHQFHYPHSKPDNNLSWYVFDSLQHFLQSIQSESTLNILLQSNTFIYMLNVYPNDQLAPQSIFVDKSWNPDTKASDFYERLQELIRILLESNQEWLKDNPQADNLYAFAKIHLQNTLAKKYGRSRSAALCALIHSQSWHDVHKEPPSMPIQNNLAEDFFVQQLIDLEKNRFPRILKTKKIKQLAHIVPQIVDGKHAPTKLFCSLTEYAKHFDVYIAASERLCHFLLEYPTLQHSSESSIERGKQTLEKLKSFPIKIFDHSLTYLKTAQEIAIWLKDQEIDYVIFHGPDEINMLCASLTDVPQRIFFDHGTLPLHYCFEKVIFSTKESFDSFDQIHNPGVRPYLLNFGVNMREGWAEEAFSLKEIGLPEKCFPLTTISNHLEARVGRNMIKAICQILQNCPEAVYAPIGEIRNPSNFLKFFAAYGMEKRVYLLGRKDNPGQYARTMKIYLNEFPFGSGLAILEAMAAGCPVVSMFDEKGPSQARYGATYYGEEKVIKSGDIDAYVSLACRLIQEPSLYLEWSNDALRRYDQFSDVQSYVKTFEDIVLS